MRMNGIISVMLAVSMLFTFSSCRSYERVRDNATESQRAVQTDVISSVAADNRTNPYKDESMKRIIKVTANGKSLYATLEENSSADAFYEILISSPLTVDMHDYGSFEKVGPIGRTLPRNDTQITTRPGDIILYQGNQVTVYYDVNTWNFTLLGHIDADRDELLLLLGDGDVTVTFSVE